MITIALDAMGGDHAPRAEVEGAILAARELGVRILLVGIEATVRQELNKHRHRELPIEVVNATEVITMSDSPSQAFRRKKDSSVHVAAKLVRDGKADALVSEAFAELDSFGEKAETLLRLRDGDRSIPASRVRRDDALILADRAAAARLGTEHDPEKACPGPDPGWMPVLGKDHAQRTS